MLGARGQMWLRGESVSDGPCRHLGVDLDLDVFEHSTLYLQ